MDKLFTQVVIFISIYSIFRRRHSNDELDNDTNEDVSKEKLEESLRNAQVRLYNSVQSTKRQTILFFVLLIHRVHLKKLYIFIDCDARSDGQQ